MKGKEGVYDFSSKKVTIKSNVYRGMEGDVWPYPATYSSAAASRRISRNLTLLSDRTIKT